MFLPFTKDKIGRGNVGTWGRASVFAKFGARRRVEAVVKGRTIPSWLSRQICHEPPLDYTVVPAGTPAPAIPITWFLGGPLLSSSQGPRKGDPRTRVIPQVPEPSFLDPGFSPDSESTLGRHATDYQAISQEIERGTNSEKTQQRSNEEEKKGSIPRGHIGLGTGTKIRKTGTRSTEWARVAKKKKRASSVPNACTKQCDASSKKKVGVDAGEMLSRL